MKIGPAIAAGAVAGVIGAAIWGALAYFAQIEIGWLAWGIGAAVGFAMAAAAQQTAPQLGALAVVFTVLSIVGGKYIAVQASVSKAVAEVGDWESQYEDEQYLVGLLADEEIAARMQAGQPVNWPAGVNPEEAVAEADYPADVWGVAKDRWGTMSADERSQFKSTRLTEARASFDSLISSVTTDAFKGSFGGMDLIFFGLAIITAFQVAGRQSASA